MLPALRLAWERVTTLLAKVGRCHHEAPIRVGEPLNLDDGVDPDVCLVSVRVGEGVAMVDHLRRDWMVVVGRERLRRPRDVGHVVTPLRVLGLRHRVSCVGRSSGDHAVAVVLDDYQ